MTTITKKQAELCRAISHQIDRARGQYGDLLKLAAREVGMTVTEALIQLDGLADSIDAPEEVWPEGANTKIVFAKVYESGDGPTYVRETTREMMMAARRAEDTNIGIWVDLTTPDGTKRSFNVNLMKGLVPRP